MGDVMTTDRLTKALLAAIAVAPWINAANPWIRPLRASADVGSDISDINRRVRSIESNLSGIYSGICLNSKIC